MPIVCELILCALRKVNLVGWIKAFWAYSLWTWHLFICSVLSTRFICLVSCRFLSIVLFVHCLCSYEQKTREWKTHFDTFLILVTQNRSKNNDRRQRLYVIVKTIIITCKQEEMTLRQIVYYLDYILNICVTISNVMLTDEDEKLRSRWKQICWTNQRDTEIVFHITILSAFCSESDRLTIYPLTRICCSAMPVWLWPFI